MIRECRNCDEEIDHEECNYCPVCGEQTLEVEYGVIWRYNVAGDSRWESFRTREEALSTAEEYISPDNCPDDYDWTVDEDPDGEEVIWTAEEGRLGGARNLPAEEVTVVKEVNRRASRTSASDGS